MKKGVSEKDIIYPVVDDKEFLVDEKKKEEYLAINEMYKTDSAPTNESLVKITGWCERWGKRIFLAVWAVGLVFVVAALIRKGDLFDVFFILIEALMCSMLPFAMWVVGKFGANGKDWDAFYVPDTVKVEDTYLIIQCSTEKDEIGVKLDLALITEVEYDKKLHRVTIYYDQDEWHVERHVGESGIGSPGSITILDCLKPSLTTWLKKCPVFEASGIGIIDMREHE